MCPRVDPPSHCFSILRPNASRDRVQPGPRKACPYMLGTVRFHLRSKSSVVTKDDGIQHDASSYCTTKGPSNRYRHLGCPPSLPSVRGAANRVGPTPRSLCRRPARAVDGWSHLHERPSRGETWGTGECIRELKPVILHSTPYSVPTASSL